MPADKEPDMSGYVPKSAEDSRAAEGLSLLGQAAAYRRDYAPEVLEPL